MLGNSALPDYDDVAVMPQENGFDNPRWAFDKTMSVTFYTKAVQSKMKSKEAGRPIFDEKEFVRIIAPGNHKSVFDDLVTPEHRVRFKERYDRFKKGLSQATSGTPLEMWPQMSVSMVAELKAMEIHTVEQLAALPDANAQKIMGYHELRRRAQTFLDAAAGEATNNKMQEELEKRDSEIAALKAQMEQILLMGQQKPVQQKK
jgi:hypothetical protein